MEDRSLIIEGGDIFATDMEQVEEKSKITATFEESTVFVTGGTGFIGKLFLEKLLRLSKTVKVLVMVRPKKGKETARRFEEIFEGPNMVLLKLKNPNFGQQVRLIEGDCTERDLGLSDETKELIINEVNFIIHCAATVRFDEELKRAAHINVRAVGDLIKMAKQMRNLKAFLHVSTAYAFCPLETIDEKFYQPGMNPEDLLHLVDTMNEKKLKSITPELIKDWPNTYVFTKAIGEELLRKEAGRLPIAILRPSIVIGTKSEPVAGWIDNLYGLTGFFLGVAVGFIRVLLCNYDRIIDLIPADYVMNTGFAVLWDLARRRYQSDEEGIPEQENEQKVPIYNVVSSAESPITLRQMMINMKDRGFLMPPMKMMWYPVYLRTENLHVYTILCFLTQTVPAYIVDALCYILGKERMLVKAQRKADKFTEVVNYFCSKEWKFHNQNTQTLWTKLEPEDRRMYPFSMQNFDWFPYMHYYLRGSRMYLLNDPMETVPKARRRVSFLLILHTFLIIMLVALFATILYSICRTLL